MTAQSRFRVAAAVGALIAPLALVAATVGPADAAVKKHKHDVTTYKVEKFVKLTGVATSTPGSSTFQGTLGCDSADDHALDGMWLVQHVDRFEPPYVDPTDPDDDPDFPPMGDPIPTGGYNDERDVFAWWSYPETGAGNGSKWAFKLENLAQGDAQVKLWVTCVKGKTAKANGHAHPVGVSNGATTGATHTSHAGRWRFDWDGGGCATAGSYLVAPGFKITNGVQTRLVASFPWRDGANEKWKWEFAGPAGAEVNFYAKCISRTTGTELAHPDRHRHAIVMKHLPRYTGHPLSLGPVGYAEQVGYSCDQDHPGNHGFKAAVGWFWMANAHEHWFLGMEPRPKSRVFSFWNTHPSEHRDVSIGAFCINSRTGNPVAP